MRRCFCLLSGLLPFFLMGQYSFGYRPDAYSGLQALYRQPAALAEMPLKMDIQLGGVDVWGWNDYLGWRRQALFQDSLRRWRDRQPNTIPEALDGSDKSFYLASDFHLPGIAFRVNDSLGLALSARMRSLTNARGLGEPMMRLLYHQGQRPELWDQPLENDHLQFLSASFLEVGLGGGATIFRRGDHRLKAGLTLKLSFAASGAYLSIDRLQYRLNSADSLQIDSIQARIGNGYPEGRYDVPFASPLVDLQPGAPGWALDMGMLYEYGRLEDGLYQWRMGIALTDLGQLNIPRQDTLAGFSGQAEDLLLPELIPGVAYDSVVTEHLTTAADREAFELQMPLALTIHGDVRIDSRWAVGWTARAGLYSRSRPLAFRPPSLITITPRWAGPWLAVGVPMSLDERNQFSMGLVLRLGPLTIGSGHVLGLFLTDNLRSADLFAQVHIPIPYRDRDKEPNEEDVPVEEIPPQPIVQEDSLPADTVIPEVVPKPTRPPVSFLPPRASAPLTVSPKAPQVSATPESPEGINVEMWTDAEWADMMVTPPSQRPAQPVQPQQAPAKPLTAEEIAAIEAAEAEARRAARAARSTESVSPSQTDEPTRPIRSASRPYQDSVQTSYNSGPLAAYFPYADSDGDGVPNKEDACPQTPGIPTRRGCPDGDPRGLPASARAPKGLELDALERVFFAQGETYLDGKSRIALNRVLRMLRAQPQTSLRIVGHADAMGGNRANELLSQKRCEVVREYFLDKGIAADRLQIEAYGERMPAADNKTADGRQRNRRVALMLFEP